jgi:proteasome accessory factor C
MPKMTKVFGPERTNLMYAIIGHVMNVGEASIAELAERFGYTATEVEEAVRSIGVADTGETASYFNSPFELDYDALEEEQIVTFVDHSVEMATPRLTTKQTAAISAGLKVLEQIPGFEYRDEVAELLDALHAGSGAMDADTIQVATGHVDSDILLLREAILNSVAIRCNYRNGKGEVTEGRVIEPLRLESRDQVWYLRGFCVSKNQEVRVFRLDAMDAVELTDLPIDETHKQIPLEGDLYEAGENAISVVLEVDPEAYAVLHDYKASVSDKPKGTVRAEIKVSSLLTLPPMVASYGGAVRVLAPAEARVLVRNFALAALGEPVPVEGAE